MSAAVDPKKAAWLGFDGLAVVSTAGLRLWRTGYTFETGDQMQYLLGPYRHIYPDFAKGDWMVWETNHYHVAYTWLIRLLHAVAGEQWFAHAVFAAHVLGLVWLSYAVLSLAKALGAHRIAACLAMLVVAWTQGLTVGGNTLSHAQLLASDLAHIPFMLCCAAWLRGDLLRAGVYLGLSGLIHANYATLAPLVIAGAELLDVRLRIRPSGARGWWATRGRMLELFVPFVLIASPTLLTVVRATLMSHADPAAVLRFLTGRAPHHYDLRSFVRREWLTPLLALLLALPALGCLARNRERVRWLTIMGLAVVAIGWLGALLGSGTIIQLRVWRIVVPLHTLLLVLASDTIVRSWTEGGWGVRAWTAVGSFLFFCACYDDAFVSSSKKLLIFAIPLLCAGAFAMLAKSLRERLSGGAAAACVLATGIWLYTQPKAKLEPQASLGRASNAAGWVRVRLRTEASRGERDLYRRIRKELPVTARFLAPPSLADFRVRTRRAIFVDWKSTPMGGDEAVEWVRRIQLTVGGALRSRGFPQLKEIDARYKGRPTERYARIARAEKLTHVIATRELEEPQQSGLRFLFRSGKYYVYAVDAR
jgi:hypothetical protein